ncbi:MAG: cell envelope integrity protein TolA [Burkholderiales bacterium]|nr:cell envelope integrity protein TolA [Burkholderiales bacterium]
MTVAAINSREQALAGALAFAIHVLLLVLLVFGVSWQHQQMDTAVVVDLWRDLPQVPQPKAEPPPPAVKPEPPPPAPKVEVKPPPVKPAPTPTIKPDIALKEKLEKERKLKEQQAVEVKKIAEAKVREAEAEKKKRAAADALKQKQAAEAAAKSLAAEQQKARDALAAQQAAAAQREIDKYMDGIRTRVRRFVLVPPSLQGNPEAEATVTLLPGGEVLDVRISKSSGNAAYDAAIESAIRKAQPFSVPAGALFQQNFRRFTMIFRPVQ